MAWICPKDFLSLMRRYKLTRTLRKWLKTSWNYTAPKDAIAINTNLPVPERFKIYTSD
jgi:hypothetical protein